MFIYLVIELRLLFYCKVSNYYNEVESIGKWIKRFRFCFDFGINKFCSFEFYLYNIEKKIIFFMMIELVIIECYLFGNKDLMISVYGIYVLRCLIIF